ncbi:MAG: S8 family serine peptidase [Pyrinomonadaceae bacterium]
MNDEQRDSRASSPEEKPGLGLFESPFFSSDSGATSDDRIGAASDDRIWVPGVIDVEFKETDRSGLKTWNFFGPDERTDFSEAWSDELKQLLEQNEMETWKPSFSLRYEGSEKSTESALDFYERSGRYRFVTFTFPRDTEIVALADQLQALPEIVRAAPEPRLAPPSPLTEPLMGASGQVSSVSGSGGTLETQWYIFRCNIEQAWTKTNASGEKLSGKGVVIADIDWGFNPYHIDLQPQIKLRRNTIENTEVVTHGNVLNHGTAVLGLAGAEVNGIGIAGIAHKASLWAIQAGADFIVDNDLWVSAIEFVRDQPTKGRKVIVLEAQTLSGRNVESSIRVNKSIVDAIHTGVVVCVPAGNGGGDAGIGDDGKPILPTGSILVGATRYDASANLRGLSNVGCRIVVYAPGDERHDVTCDSVDTGAFTNYFGGTSSAVAKVAGVVALMLEMNPELRHEQVRDILARSQIPVVDYSSNQVGVLLDAAQAVCEAGQLAGRPC